MQTFTEEWRPVKNYEGLYEVSNLGKVRSLDRMASNGVCEILYKGREIKPFLDGRKNYFMLTLSKSNIKQKFLVHRLVAEAFIPNPENKPEVNHINGIKSDCRAINLEWVSSKENKAHAIKNGYYNTPKFKCRKSIKGSKAFCINGETKSLYVWAKELGVSYDVLRWKYDHVEVLPNGWRREKI